MSKRPWEFESPVCAEVGNFYFYIEDKDDRSEDPLSGYEVAKALCSRCIHKTDCAEWGIKNESHGMWGGTTPKERAQERSKRGIRLDVS